MWNASGVSDTVEKRMGWGLGGARVGSVGKAIQTIGMARVSFFFLSHFPSLSLYNLSGNLTSFSRHIQSFDGG